MDTTQRELIRALAATDSRVVVVAGNRAEAEMWCRENGIARCRMIYATRQSVRGLGELPVVKVGTWYSRRNLGEIMRMVAANAARTRTPQG